MPVDHTHLNRLALKVQADEAHYPALERELLGWLRIGLSQKYHLPGQEFGDLEQVLRLGLWQAARSYIPDRCSSFRAWARFICERRLQDELNKARQVQTSIDLKALSLDGLLDSDDPMPEPSVESFEEELIERLAGEEAIRRLAEVATETELAVLEGTLLGLNYEEAAERIGKRPKVADNALQRLRMKARRLAEEGEAA